MLPDEVQIKKLRKLVGCFYPKHLKSFLDGASKSENYDRDKFLQQFNNDYDFILKNPSKKK